MTAGARLQIVCVATCWRCGVCFCPWAPGLFTVLYPQDVTQPIPYLKCDGCGQLAVKADGDCTLVEIGASPS